MSKNSKSYLYLIKTLLIIPIGFVAIMCLIGIVTSLEYILYDVSSFISVFLVTLGSISTIVYHAKTYFLLDTFPLARKIHPFLWRAPYLFSFLMFILVLRTVIPRLSRLSMIDIEVFGLILISLSIGVFSIYEVNKLKKINDEINIDKTSGIDEIGKP